VRPSERTEVDRPNNAFSSKERIMDNTLKSNFVINIIVVASLIITAIIFGINNLATEMGLIIAAHGVALFFLNLEKFKKFKGAGIEAEMKEVVSKAYAAIEDLKDLGLTLADPIVTELTISGNMMQYLHLKYKLEFVEKIRISLQKLHATENEIEQATNIIYKDVEKRHMQRILGNLKAANTNKIELFTDLDNWKFREWNYEKIEKFITDNTLLVNDAVSDYLEDFKYFITNRTLRREDEWQS
jgi:hypothetical protein